MSSEKKDFWDILQIMSGVLIPIAIFFVGNKYSELKHQTELELQEKRFEQEIKIAAINSKVGQIGLVPSFFEALLSDNEKRKKLAIEAILVAIPDEGPSLVKVVSELKEDKSISEFATNSLASRRFQLVKLLFSDEKSERLNAYQEIVSGWKSDSEMAIDIVKFGSNNLSNEDGVYNALVTLSHLNKDALSKYSEEIIHFSNEAEKNGDNSRKRAEVLRSRIPGS